MDYLDYYKDCKEHSDLKNEGMKLEDLLSFGQIQELSIPIDLITPIVKLSKEYFGKMPLTKYITNYTNNVCRSEFTKLADYILPDIEKNIFGCPIYVDQVVLYRSIYAKAPKGSKKWHYDNHPQTVFKVLIYLNDVLDETDGPMEYIPNELHMPTRIGPFTNWTRAPNDSRIDEDIDHSKVISIFGKTGHGFLFSPLVTHRGRIPAKNKYRDALCFRIRPCRDRESYISPKYTSYAHGPVPDHPQTMRCPDVK
jgi:hypothetical protein